MRQILSCFEKKIIFFFQFFSIIILQFCKRSLLSGENKRAGLPLERATLVIRINKRAGFSGLRLEKSDRCYPDKIHGLVYPQKKRPLLFGESTRIKNLN